jgi:hypothetical protein
MISAKSANAIRQLLRKTERNGELAWSRHQRRRRRVELQPLLSGRRLTETRDGVAMYGLRQVLKGSGGPSDSSRILGRVKASPSKVRRWCSQLLDATLSPAERLAVLQDGHRIPHLGRNAFSLLLHLKEPDRFGSLNKAVEQALRTLGEWPRFPKGSGEGDKYLQVNAILNELADETGVRRYKGESLAVLDWLLWYFQDSGMHISATKRRDASQLPADEDAELSAVEGGNRRLRTHLQAERKPWLVAGLKRQRVQTDPNLECEVCGFSFLLVYGECGEGFIEAHHREEISTRGRRRSTKNDFHFVCSNCHRMLHRLDSGEMDIDRLRKLVVKRRTDARKANDRWWAKS